MAINFSAIKLDVIDLTTNATPDIYINQSGITFSKHVLEDLGYPSNVQYCTDPAHKIFAIRSCKSNDAKAVPFSKSRSEQSSALCIGNKNLHDILVLLISGYQPKKRYKVVGEFDSEKRTMYYDMSTAEVSDYRAPKD